MIAKKEEENKKEISSFSSPQLKEQNKEKPKLKRKKRKYILLRTLNFCFSDKLIHFNFDFVLDFCFFKLILQMKKK